MFVCCDWKHMMMYRSVGDNFCEQLYNTLPRPHQASEFREGYHNNKAANDAMEADTLITFIILEANCFVSGQKLCSAQINRDWHHIVVFGV